MDAWPLFDLRLQCRGVSLRAVREADLAHLAAIQPSDYEHDPAAEMLAGLSHDQNRRRLVYQGYWRSVGTWSVRSWTLDMVVERDSCVVGVQSLEAENFPRLRTVDSGSWLIEPVRGQGVGIAMRMAALGLAFDHLGALAAISSARADNAASLGVSRRIGYQPNGISLNDSGNGRVELQHLRLTSTAWKASGLSKQVRVEGVEACRPWFFETGSKSR